MKKIGFSIACYNEEENILDLYHAIIKQMDKLDYEFTMVFIDNKSTDNSRNILTDLARKDDRVQVIMNRRNFGPGRSSAYGLFHTPGDAVIAMACDLQDPPELIPEFLKKWEDGAELVLGRKESSDEKKSMFFIRKIYYCLMKILIKENELDQITGFGLYDNSILEEMKQIYDPNPNFRFLIQKFGFSPSLIEYNQPARQHGVSSYNFFSYLDTAILSVVTNSNQPLRYVSIIGLCSFVLSSFLLLVLFIIFAITGSLSSNLYIILSILLLQFLSFTIGCVGIVGEYVGEMSDRVKHYPWVSVERTINYDRKEDE